MLFNMEKVKLKGTFTEKKVSRRLRFVYAFFPITHSSIMNLFGVVCLRQFGIKTLFIAFLCLFFWSSLLFPMGLLPITDRF